ncbi:MAG TPA: SBBP repeat-containing protein [Gemmatimonadaceae bacterium]|nr:SBBP repeat-containing protein [Gemmatimonadaceae bacterium]
MSRRSIVPACFAMLAGVALAVSSAAQPQTVVGSEADVRAVGEHYGRLPLYFEPVGDAARGGRTFIARAAHYLIAVSKEGARLALRPRPSDPSVTATVALRFLDADARASIDGADPQEARIHRFGGADGNTHVDVPTFGSVVVSGLYAGVDAVFHGSGRALEYDLVIAPTADPSSIVMRVEGASHLSIDESGDLALETSVGIVKIQRPAAFQHTPHGREPIESRFVLAGAHDVRIAVGDYDASRPLTVDPVISYATWLGGTGGEQANAIAVDAAGNAYVVGWTNSNDFPLLTPYDRTLGKYDTDAFVSKLNAAGTALVWSTYLGGSSNPISSSDRALGVAVDTSGKTYVIGTTDGSDFPVSANAYQKGVAGGGSFVAKLGPAGNTLVYSTYLVGATAHGIAVDSAGNAYVAGSATPSFTTTPDALRTVAGSSVTGFVVKLNATGSAPVFASYLGGTGGDTATSIAVDAQGNAYVGGWTTSSDFPLVNAFQVVRRGGKEGFVAKVDASGTRLAYATLLGGALDDQVNAIAVDAKGSAYVAGETYSWDFPVKDGFQMQKAGARLVNSSVGNAFVAKLEPAGNALAYGSFLGGEVCLSLCQLVFGGTAQYRGDAAYAIAVDGAGHAHVAGIARTYTFPLVDSSARRMRDDTEDSAFVSKVSIAGSSLLWSTFTRTGFHGDTSNRYPLGAATGVAVDPAGNAYVSGDADSYSDFQATPGALQVTNTASNAAIVVKFPAAPAMTLTTSNARADMQTAVTLTATLSGAPVSGTLTFLANGVPVGASVPFVGTSASATMTLPAGVLGLTAVLRLPGVASDTAIVNQVVDLALTCPAS